MEGALGERGVGEGLWEQRGGGEGETRDKEGWDLSVSPDTEDEGGVNDLLNMENLTSASLSI